MENPSSWKKYQLDELLEYEQPTPYIVESTEYNDAYQIPVLTAGKSFIIGKTNEKTGIYTKLPVIIFDDFTTATQYVNFPFKVKSSAMKILSANTKLILLKFAYHLMQTIKCEHSTHKRYWIQEYSQIRVSVPPLPEQERIVARIEELFSDLDKGVEALQTIKAQLKVYRQAAIVNCFEAANAAGVTTLSKIADINGGITKGQRYSQDTDLISLPYLRVANVQDGYLDLQEIKEILLRARDRDKYTLRYGDVLYTEGGDRDKLGRGTIWRNQIPECVHQNHVFRARVNRKLALPEFVAYWSLTKTAKDYFFSSSKQTVNLASINKTVLSALPIPLPEIDIQAQIIRLIESRLSVCDKIEQAVDESLAKAESLRQSILKKAFEGRL